MRSSASPSLLAASQPSTPTRLRGQPSILNGYALAAYLAVGLAGGLAYWLVAGRRAGGKRADAPPTAVPPAGRSRTGSHNRTELSPVSHAQLCCCIAAIGLAFCAMLAGARRSHAACSIRDLQQRFTSRCTDAALGYSAASTAAYAAFAEQVLNFWSAVLQPPGAKPPPASQLVELACAHGAARAAPPAPQFNPFNPFAWMLPAAPPPSPPAPPCRPIPGKPCRRSPTL